MPAPVALSPTAHTSSKATGSKPRAPPQSKKTRIVRRRGRAKDGLESDDEIEREVGTDSETDEDQSSVDSASDSDTEPASEDVLPNGHARILSPSLSGEVVSVSKSHSTAKVAVNGDQSAFFAGAAGNWSEMVADENDNGPAALPVIDFADFDGHADQRQPRIASKEGKKPTVSRKVSAPVSVPSASVSVQDEVSDGEEPVASTSQQASTTFQRHAAGPTARQAYQQRLDKDPSYVPTVGEFWGHDDRLLDKDLRSLSGWWRGRWQGRGRGRGGFDRGFMRGRGRGGFFGPQQHLQSPKQGPEHVREVEGDETTPPIERAWTHDGFEEMKLWEENRRPVQQQPPFAQSSRGVGGLPGGRGGFSPRGRGGFGRGAMSSSPLRSNTALSFAPPSGRTWFAMKPERVWTKQHDGFLHIDPTLKPHSGQGQGIQVKLPGTAGQVVRVPPGLVKPSQSPNIRASVPSANDGEKIFLVRIPKRAGKEKSQMQPATAELATTAEPPPVDDAFTVRARHVTRPAIPDSEPAAPASITHVPHPEPIQAAPAPESSLVASPLRNAQSLPDTTTIQVDDQGWIQPDPGSNHSPDHQEVPPVVDTRLPPPVLPPIQTSFTPVPQTSPPYGSPFGYQPGLPPGVAVNQQGMPYEVSTGRVIYYQPPPPPVYNPRPIMHTHMAPPVIPFVPGHMRHLATASPDFIAPSHTPPVNGFVDPSTGMPLFSMPRQSSRIEIRAPSDQVDRKFSPSTIRQSSSLRTAATAFEPRSAGGNAQGHNQFPNSMSPHSGSYGAHAGEDAVEQQMMDPTMMGYPPYQQQYYYPAEHYGYSQYMDPSQAQYEIYPQDPHAVSQPAIYY